MAAETGAGGAFLIKSGLLIGLISTMAAGLGFAIAWPESGREAFYRFTSASIGSIVLGVPLAFAAWHNWPWMFTEMVTLVSSFCSSFHVGVSETEARFLGVLLAACPFLFSGALPFWWLSRAAVLWFVKRKGKDLGQLVEDGMRTYRRLQP